MTPEELEALSRPGPLPRMEDPWLKDIPAIADHALEILDKLQDRETLLREISLLKDDDHYIDYNDTLRCNCTHAGNGERFILWYGHITRYCPPFEWWYIWNDKEGRWARDDMGIVCELGKNVVRNLYLEAHNAPTRERREKVSKWAVKCENPGSVNQLLESARTDTSLAVSIDLFDSESYHLNLLNGWVDLNSMEFHPHTKKKFFTMVLPFEYSPVATCPQWLAFLNRIFRSNPEKDRVIAFLQKAVGYTLTGDTSERLVFLMHGLGANGKTVFIRVLEALFGEYGSSVSSTTFTTAMTTNVRNDIAKLKGKRFVWASENATGTVLDEEMIKRASGGDTLVCRFLHKEEFSYRPNFKIWWIFNHKPAIKDATDSIWDRIRLIPCLERIPSEEQDKKLVDKLITELPGIFNWAIVGLKKFRNEGLAAPETVRVATGEYRNDEDALFDFLNDYFEIQKDKELSEDWRVSFKEIYDIYKAWSVDQGFKAPWSKTRIGKILGERFKQIRTDHGRSREYLGLRVKGQRSLGDKLG